MAKLAAAALLALIALHGAHSLHHSHLPCGATAVGSTMCGARKLEAVGIRRVLGIQRGAALRGGAGSEDDGDSVSEADKQSGSEEGKEVQEGAKEVAEPGYKAAFGIVVGTPSGAAIVNLAITAAMAGLMTFARTHFTATVKSMNEDGSLGNAGGFLGNPKITDLLVAVLYGCTILQGPLVAYLLGKDLGFMGKGKGVKAADGSTPFFEGLYKDFTGGWKGVKMTPKEAQDRLKRQMTMLKAMRFVTILSILYVTMQAKNKKTKERGGESSASVGDGYNAADRPWPTFDELRGRIVKGYTDIVKKVLETTGLGELLDPDADGEEDAEESAASASESADTSSKPAKPATGAQKLQAKEKDAKPASEGEDGAPKGTVTRLLSFFTKTPALRGEGSKDGDAAPPALRGDDSTTAKQECKVKDEESSNKVQLRGGKDQEDEEKGGEKGNEEGKKGGKRKKDAGLIDMVPAPLRPLAQGAVLVAFMSTLCSQVYDLYGDTRWVKLNKYDKQGVKLTSNPQKKGEQLAGFVVSAFEDMGLRRNHYIKYLGAAMAAVGSAQGIMRMFADTKDMNAPGTVWLSSPIARYISSINGQMVWMGLSFALGQLGHYDKSAIMYLDRPKDWTIWAQKGMVRGKVTTMQQMGSNYTIGVVVNMADGSKMRHSHNFDLKSYEQGEEKLFDCRKFAQDVQTKLVLELPWLEGSEKLSLANGSYVADGFEREVDDDDGDEKAKEDVELVSDSAYEDEDEDEDARAEKSS